MKSALVPPAGSNKRIMAECEREYRPPSAAELDVGVWAGCQSPRPGLCHARVPLWEVVVGWPRRVRCWVAVPGPIQSGFTGPAQRPESDWRTVQA